MSDRVQPTSGLAPGAGPRLRAGVCAAVAALVAGAAVAEPFEAALLRLPDGGLAMQVRGLGAADPANVRLLFDVDGRGTGLPANGADFMIEGGVAFRYPAAGTGWNWDELCGAASVVGRDGTANYLLPACVRGPVVRWAVELLDATWSPVRRVPAEGFRETVPDSAPDLGPGPEAPAPAVAGHVTASAGPSLSVRFRDELARAAWTDAPSATPVPQAILPGGGPVASGLRLIDPATGRATNLVPARVAVSGAAVRWDGRADGLAWTALFEPAGQGAVRVRGELENAGDRCVRIEAFATLPPGAWMWHDGPSASRSLAGAKEPLSSTMPAGFGARGAQSRLPFGLVASPAGVLSVECDPDEPRVFEIRAGGTTQELAIAFDLGLTPLTAKFPGRATFSAVFAGAARTETDPFRTYLAAWHRARGRSSAGACLQWLPSGAIPAPVQFFGSAPVAMELDEPGMATPPGAAGYGRMQPWDVVIPWPPKVPADPPQVLRMLHFLAATDGPYAFFARAALVAGARDPAGGLVSAAEASPDGSVRVRMAASADPDFMTTPGVPVNPGAAQMGRAAAFAESGAAGLVLAGLPGVRGLDFNRAALAAADHPCSYAPGEWKPGLAAPVAASEFMTPLARTMHAQGRRLAILADGDLHPALAALADIVVSPATAGGGAVRPELRWLAGPSPFVTVLSGDFAWEDAERLGRWLAGALAGGAIASPGADADGVPYWAKPEYAARDRGALGTYLAPMYRLAAAGWRADGAPEVRGETVRAEAFGAPDAPVHHLVLANTSDLPASAGIQVAVATNPAVVVHALTGLCEPLAAVSGAAPVRVALAGGETAVLDVVAPGGMEAELAWLQAWRAPGGESAACLKNLASLAAEGRAGAPAWISHPTPAIRGVPNELALRVLNRAGDPLVVAGVQVRAGGRTRSVGAEPRILGAGEAAEFRTAFTEQEADGWMDLEWRVQRGTQEWACVRTFRPRFAEAVDAIPPDDEWRSASPVASIPVVLRNNSRQTQEAIVAWEGDFGRGRQVTALAPGMRREIAVALAGEPGRTGRLRLTLEAAGRTGYRGEHRIAFLGAGANRARDSRARIEADSARPGQPAAAAADGQGTGGAGGDGGWCSDFAAADHWLRIAWPDPQPVSTVVLSWPSAGGRPAPGLPGLLRGWTEDGTVVDLGVYRPGPEEAATTVTFEPARLRAVEIRQPAPVDPASLPRALHLIEVEVR